MLLSSPHATRKFEAENPNFRLTKNEISGYEQAMVAD
jgi:hypothetical protein